MTGVFVFYFLATLHCIRILAPRPQIKPVPPSVEVWHLNYWTTSKVPTGIFVRGAIWTHRHTQRHCVQVKDQSDKIYKPGTTKILGSQERSNHQILSQSPGQKPSLLTPGV